MRTPFISCDMLPNASLPNGSRPGTWNTTSSVINDSTVAVSPAWLAFIHVETRLRMARSSSVIRPASCCSWGGLSRTRVGFCPGEAVLQSDDKIKAAEQQDYWEWKCGLD